MLDGRLPADLSILLGQGDGTFSQPINNSIDYFNTSLTAGDVNGDHRLDIFMISKTGDSVSVLLGNGDGTFQPAQKTNVSGSPTDIVAGDFNLDGRLDVAVSTFQTKKVLVFLGKGDGAFQPSLNLSVSAQPISLIASDINGDGKDDLAVTTSDITSNNLSLLFGVGDGNFLPAIDYSVGNNPQAVAAGDLDANGQLDLVIANTDASTVSVLLNGGSGVFPQPPELL